MSSSHFDFKQFRIEQDRCAMKVGTDGVLLGAWANIPPTATPTILDIGTGTGIVALMLAQRYPTATVTAIDIDGDAAAQAKANVEASPFANRISVHNMALQDIIEQKSAKSNNREAAEPQNRRTAEPYNRSTVQPQEAAEPHNRTTVQPQEAAEPYNAIVCNPPYFYDSLLCPDSQRTTARHALTLTARALAQAAATLLSDGGELSVILPYDQRGRMESEAVFAGLFLKRLCAIKTTTRKPASRVLMAFTNRHCDELEQTTITIGDEKYRELTSQFYLD